jgi:hypothetical protein
MHRKREHLLNQIQNQAKQIENLMRELEKVAPNRDQRLSDHLESKFNDFQLSSDPNLENGIDDDSALLSEDPEANEVLSDWIAKAKESFQEFGILLAIGGAALPKSYLMEEDEDEADSNEEEYMDAEEPEDDDASYKITVEDQTPEAHVDERRIQHKSSTSSLNTSGTTNTSGQRRKNQSESSKPANLPVEASPFGLFGTMVLKSPKSRATSIEPEEEEYKGPGIANENFFSASEHISLIDYQYPDYFRSQTSSCSECSRSQVGVHATPVAGYSDSKHHHAAGGRETFQNLLRQHESFGVSLGSCFVHSSQNALSQSILVHRQ